MFIWNHVRSHPDPKFKRPVWTEKVDFSKQMGKHANLIHPKSKPAEKNLQKQHVCFHSFRRCLFFVCFHLYRCSGVWCFLFARVVLFLCCFNLCLKPYILCVVRLLTLNAEAEARKREHHVWPGKVFSPESHHPLSFLIFKVNIQTKCPGKRPQQCGGRKSIECKQQELQEQ